MKKIQLTKKQRRTIIILMGINLFALFVNFFNLSPKIESNTKNDLGQLTSTNRYYLLTDSNSYSNKTKDFWPFTQFTDSQPHHGRNYTLRYRFYGIFTNFDHSEFLVYCLLIFGVVFIPKIW